MDRVEPLLRELCRTVESDRLHAAGFVSYDGAPAMDGKLAARRKGDFPLLRFGLYESRERISLPSTGEGISPLPWTPTIGREEFFRAMDQIREEIFSGNTYQVNYTYRLNTPFEGDPWAYFLQLQKAQNARYAAFLRAGEWTVCSASPELFFSLEGENIEMRPMKGTAPRGTSLKEDRKMAEWLRNSEKNRAENRMIVDMIRNDLGKIARRGSLSVPELFTLEKYPTLWQMTSRITAETDESVPEIFRALFPCASITGAPKRRTMEIIKAGESTPRGLYTGAIGYISPGRRSQFNVAIRTVLINGQTGTAEYGTGGGVTWDSTAGEEYEETRIKARVLTALKPEFSLLESLLWTPEEGYYLLERHLCRMAESAEYFSFPFRGEEIRNRLASEARRYPPVPLKIRLLSDRDGKLFCEHQELRPLSRLSLKLAESPVDRSDSFLYHKTTHRDIYERARKSHPGYDDVLLWNEKGEITETCIGNIVVVWRGKAYTPPVSSGLLAGTQRDELLGRGLVTERILTREDLLSCEEIYLVNSVRKRLDVTLTL